MGEKARAPPLLGHQDSFKEKNHYDNSGGQQKTPCSYDSTFHTSIAVHTVVPLECRNHKSQRVTTARPSPLPQLAIAVLRQPHSEWGLEQCQFNKSQIQKDRASLKWPHIDLHNLYAAD